MYLTSYFNLITWSSQKLSEENDHGITHVKKMKEEIKSKLELVERKDSVERELENMTDAVNVLSTELEAEKLEIAAKNDQLVKCLRELKISCDHIIFL
jgi:hypothetical protein